MARVKLRVFTLCVRNQFVRLFLQSIGQVRKLGRLYDRASHEMVVIRDTPVRCPLAVHSAILLVTLHCGRYFSSPLRSVSGNDICRQIETVIQRNEDLVVRFAIQLLANFDSIIPLLNAANTTTLAYSLADVVPVIKLLNLAQNTTAL